MLLFKVFLDIVPKKLEEKMNEWITQTPYKKIHQICTSESQGAEGFGVTVIIMYESE